jgi:hypothetical protein
LSCRTSDGAIPANAAIVGLDSDTTLVNEVIQVGDGLAGRQDQVVPVYFSFEENRKGVYGTPGFATVFEEVVKAGMVFVDEGVQSLGRPATRPAVRRQ